MLLIMMKLKFLSICPTYYIIIVIVIIITNFIMV